MADTGTKTVAQNRKAYHDYEVLDKYEAGIMLNGDEVKSIKAGQINLRGAFIDTFKEEAFLNEAHVSRYKNSARLEYNPTRKRKLLLHKNQILKIEAEMSQKGITVTPLEVYLKNGYIKILIGICRGKKLHDKREDLKKRDQEMEIKRALKKYK